MANRLMLDMDVLIDFFRRHVQATAFMLGLPARPLISAVTVAELFAGVRDGPERIQIEVFLRCSILIEIDEQIGTRAGLMLRQYRKSHSTGLADALVAAAAELSGAALVTLNTKHFPMLSNIVVPYTKA